MKLKLLILSLLITLTTLSQQQVKRLQLFDSLENKNFTRRYSSTALTFQSPLCCDPDTILVSVLSDSIDANRYTFHLFAYFPYNINPNNSTLLLNYEEGSPEILYQVGPPSENNYVEYFLVSQNYLSIFNKKVKSITFRGIGTFKLQSKDKSFFINFNKILP